MASFVSEFKLNGGEPFDVLVCDYELKREVDEKGQPSTALFGGTINVAVKSTRDTSILEAVINQHKPIDGSIIFKESDQDATMKELSFKNGYIIKFGESFDKQTKQAMTTSFTISAETISVGSATLNNRWPKK